MTAENEKQTGVERDERGRWLTGVSGNPQGRPARPLLSELFHKVLTEPLGDATRAEAMVRKIVTLAIEGNLRAAEIVLNYTVGRPATMVQVFGAGDVKGATLEPNRIMLLMDKLTVGANVQLPDNHDGGERETGDDGERNHDQ